jgi:hypothetical protein
LDNNNQTTKLLIGVAIALCVYSLINVSVLAQNVTNSSTAEELPTGQDSVPVENTDTGQTQQVAPADAVQSLLTTIFTVAVPAIIGLITAVVAIIKTFSKDKKVNEALDTAVVAAKYIDTMAPKIQEQYVTSGAFKTAFQMLMNSLPAEQRTEIEKQIVQNVPPIDKKVQATSAQINKLRHELPKKAIADNDPSIGTLDRS